jgi:hypothetical protein
MKKNLFFALAAASIFAPACAKVPEEPTDPAPTESDAAAAPEAAPMAAPQAARGFSFRVQSSRFRLGKVVSERSERGMHRVIGDEGVIAVHEATGDVRSIPNAGAPTTLVRDRPEVEAHNRAVKDYFLGLGLPQEQMMAPHVTTLHQASGSIAEPAIQPGKDTGFMAYYTNIGRQIDGIVVADSVAWARINADGEVVSEEIRWPAIPADVVHDAKKLAELMRAPESAKGFREMIGVAGEGQVMIHHATWMSPTSFEPFASYDVMDAPGGRDARARVRHFLIDGTEVRLHVFEAPPGGHDTKK